jgi:sortase A
MGKKNRGMIKRYKTVVLWILLISGSVLFGKGMYIQAKALLAQYLISDAWQQTLAHKGNKNFKPWSWADTYPVAKLVVPRLNIEQYVLKGNSGSSLAFGPGLDMNAYMPHTGGTTVIGGHRDTSFRFLQHIKKGDNLIWEDQYGESYSYSIEQLEIMDVREQKIHVDPDENTLLLVTCWPFDAIVAGGPYRLIVRAVKIE